MSTKNQMDEMRKLDCATFIFDETFQSRVARFREGAITELACVFYRLLTRS